MSKLFNWDAVPSECNIYKTNILIHIRSNVAVNDSMAMN